MGAEPIVTVDPAARLSFAGFVLDEADERLIGPAGPVRIGFKAFRLLRTLARARGKLLTKDELFDAVWDGAFVSESALTSVIKELRRALGDEPATPRYIETVYGRGYRFIPAVEEEPGKTAAESSLDSETTAASPFLQSAAANNQHSPEPRRSWRRLARWGATRRMIAGSLSVVGSIAAVVGLLHRDRVADVPAAAGVEIGAIAPDNNVPRSLPLAIRDETLSALSYSHSVEASLPGGTTLQPFILSGAVHREADQWRADFNLASRRTGQNVWSWSGQTPVAGDDAARNYGDMVAEVLRCALNGAATKPNLSEHALALYFQFCGPPLGTRSQGRVDLARRVIAADPGFAPAWAGLASWLGQMVYDGASSNPAATRAEGIRAAQHALQLDPGSADPWYAMSVLVPLDQLGKREDYVLRALNARPLDCGCLHKYLGDLYLGSGRWSDAQAQYERVLDQEPQEDGARYMRAKLQLDRDPTNAEGLAWLAHADRPKSAVAHLLLETDLNQARYKDALVHLGAFESVSPGSETAATRSAIAALASGNKSSKDAAASLLRREISNPDKRASFDVELLSQLGDPQGALVLAEAISAKAHDTGLIPLFARMSDPARRLPEFARFASRMGLISYWHNRHITPDFCRGLNPPSVCGKI